MVIAEWKTVEGFSSPKAIEMTPTRIYLRRNIRTARNKGFQGKESKGFHWIYEEVSFTPEELEEFALWLGLETSVKMQNLEEQILRLEKKLDKIISVLEGDKKKLSKQK